MSIDWEERYRTGDTPWEKGAPHPALTEYMNTHLLEGRILVPGCGQGHDVRAISRPDNEVIGIDIAPSAIQAAQSGTRIGNERYELANLFHLPPHLVGACDWVVEHTCFCAIQPAQRKDYVRAVANALKPGGKLLAVFFLNPDHGPDGPPFGVTREELDALFGGAFGLIEEWPPIRTYEGREDREWMRLLQKR